jgi:phenylpropionate dioxygenase-like ring-hydroxylating dioxygenase large terminal subunit
MTKQEAIRPADVSGSVVKEAYYQPQYLALEKQRLWPRVWQMACRVEELPEVGDHLAYDIGDESVLVVRSAPDELRAFHNVCQHRGRRLAKGCGSAQRLRCPFHGWQWDLTGKNVHVSTREDWGGLLDDQDLSLRPVKLETFGGFVFINLDPASLPLAAFLGEAAKILAPFELEKMRFRWRKWLIMPSNWKIALEAFNEGYHVSITHHQLAQYGGVSRFVSGVHGLHGMFGVKSESNTGILGANTSKSEADARKKLAEFYNYMKTAIDSNMTDTLMRAANRLLDEVPAGTPPDEVVQQLMIKAVTEDAQRGVAWPDISVDEYTAAGIDWHIFPNMVLLPMATNCLGYRARPNGDDPDTCIFEVYQLERFPEGEAPKNVPNIRNDDIYDEAFWGEILLQDFQQMEGTHRGVKSMSYKGPRLNPSQETALANFHRAYHEIVSTL